MKRPLLPGAKPPRNVPSEEKGEPYSTLLHEICRSCSAFLVGTEKISGLCTWCMFSPNTSTTSLRQRHYGHTQKR